MKSTTNKIIPFSPQKINENIEELTNTFENLNFETLMLNNSIKESPECCYFKLGTHKITLIIKDYADLETRATLNIPPTMKFVIMENIADMDMVHQK
jgi:hypothetical protein